MEQAFSDLEENGIVTCSKVYNKKKDYEKFILTYLQEKKTFEVIYYRKARQKHHNITEKYIENVLSKFSDRVREKLKKLIESTIIYCSKFRSEVKTKTIYDLLLPFFDVSDSAIVKTCDICTSEKYFGKRPLQYVHVVLKNLKEDRNYKESEIKSKSLDKYKQQQEESERRLGVKIASGKADDNISYIAILKCKDFKQLNKLYKIGAKILKEEGKEIVTNYDWVQK